MIQVLDEIERGTLPFTGGVAELETIMDAAGIEDSRLVRDWYDWWTPLEEYRAQDGDSVDLEQVTPHIAAMRRQLRAVAEGS